MHFYKFDCPKKNESEYTDNYVCETTRSKKGVYSMTIYFDIIKTVPSMDLTYILTHQTSNKVIFNFTFDFCESYQNPHPFLKIMFMVFENNSKNLFHACPYYPIKGIGIRNFAFEEGNPLLAVVNFKIGEYRAIFRGNDKNGKVVMYVNSFFSLSLSRRSKG